MMDIKKIREMDDEQLENYIKKISNKRSTYCSKCGKINVNYTMNIQNKRVYQQKKVCCLCDDCYKDMLDYLNTCDAIWD